MVCGLVLNFIADPRAALAEMMRVASGGGTVGAYVWDYAGKMELMRVFWDAAIELIPEAASLDEGIRFPLSHPGTLSELFSTAGLGQVATTSIDIPTRFESFEDYWQPFFGGQGPAPAYVLSLDESARERLRGHLLERIPSRRTGRFA